MFCSQCGTESPDELARFCHKCGQPFSQTSSTEGQALETDDSTTSAPIVDAEVSNQRQTHQDDSQIIGNSALPGGYQLATGEQLISNESFKVSWSHWWLKTNISLTNRSILWERPNLILGSIPAGRQTGNIPLGQVGSVATNRAFSIKRLLIGLLVLIVGSVIGGLLFIISIIAAACILATLFQTTLTIEHRGGPTTLKSIVTQKTKIEALSNRISQMIASDR